MAFLVICRVSVAFNDGQMKDGQFALFINGTGFAGPENLCQFVKSPVKSFFVAQKKA